MSEKKQDRRASDVRLADMPVVEVTVLEEVLDSVIERHAIECGLALMPHLDFSEAVMVSCCAANGKVVIRLGGVRGINKAPGPL